MKSGVINGINTLCANFFIAAPMLLESFETL
jgi:hypothetical protein